MPLHEPRRRTTCRLCRDSALVPALSLTPTPPANAFVDAAARETRQGQFPLDLHLCERCGHLQLLDVLSPFDLFQRGRSATGEKPSLVAQAEAFSTEILAEHQPPERALVLGIGSNDGTLLRTFEDAGYRVHGVEPAVDLARIAIVDGIPTFVGFFAPGIAARLEDEHGRADIIVAPNVLAHVDDLHAFMEAACLILARRGILAFEIPYLADLVETGLIDAVRHENLSYHAVRPLIGFLHSCDLELVSVRAVGHKSGRLRGFVQHLGGPRAADGSVAAAVAREAGMALEKIETYERLAGNIGELTARIRQLVTELRADGRTIAAIGAPARSTTLMHACGLDSETLDFVVDEAAWKQGLFTPGSHVPVLAPGAIDERRPDYAIVLTWDIAEEVMAQHAAYHDAGGRFVVPLPTPRIV